MKYLPLLVAALCTVTLAGNWETNMAEKREVIVKLFAWKWTDIAEECERFLGPSGFGGVQISPPNEHAVVQTPFRPWWEQYLPVSYELTSRSGTEEELADMVETCNKVGVRIYADVVLNHMADGEMGVGSAGNPYDPKTLSYPGVPYAAQDFNVHNEKCPTKNGEIEDYKNEKEVRNCNLFGLPDLDTSVYHVRYSVAKYLNRLIDMGVAGFVVSNAENIWPDDLKAVYESLQNLSTTFFKPGRRPFVYHEMKRDDMMDEYLPIGRVLEFEYGQILASAIRGPDTNLSSLENMEGDFYLVPSFGAVVFIDNPDTQRDSYNTIDFVESRLYVLANAFMLAFPYGVTRVMSSFTYTKYADGPPSGANGKIVSPNINEKDFCGNGWVCEHRWKEIKNMVGFRNAAAGEPLSNWWSNGNQQIAFGRGDKAFFVLNNEEATLSERLYTGLPTGEYCDVISGDFDPQSRLCTGPFISVDDLGFASLSLSKDDPPAAAIHVNAKISDEAVEETEQDNAAASPTEASDREEAGNDAVTTIKPPSTPVPIPLVPQGTAMRTTIFIHKGVGYGQHLFIRGGLNDREGCTDKANTSACAIPIRHITPGHNAECNAWKTGDNYLDWYGAEEGQGASENIQAEGTPLVWTTNDPSNTANVDTNGFGYAALNQWGDSYWMVDLFMDCARTDDGWFLLKAFVMNGEGWESDISQEDRCQGTPGGTKPYTSINHLARCGFINVFDFGTGTCTIEDYEQESVNETAAVTSNVPPTPPPVSASSPPPPSITSTIMKPTPTPSTPYVNPSAKRTVVFIKADTAFGQYVFIRGGVDYGHRIGCTENAPFTACSIPIRHLTPGDNGQYNAWKTGDNYLDWYGAEEGQHVHDNTPAEGTPLVWTTNDPTNGADVTTDGYGFTPLNQWGDNYWMVDLNMDCDKTEGGWFELKAFLMHGQGWEGDVSQEAACQGSPGGSKPHAGINHFARCGFINVFELGDNSCIINGFDQETNSTQSTQSSPTQTVTTKPIPNPTSSPSAEPSKSTGIEDTADEPTVPSTLRVNPGYNRTIIFIQKDTEFGQYLFIRGGIDHEHRVGCSFDADTSACAIPIEHLTPGHSAQYNAWKTGDNYLDWYGAENGQHPYENIIAEGTPLVWTTSDPSNRDKVAVNSYGYTPLNQWGDNYWMADLNMDCSKTEGGWFELKAFLMNGDHDWETNVSQMETCEGSVGGSRPFRSSNHFARCGFLNVFTFGGDGCIIDSLFSGK